METDLSSRRPHLSIARDKLQGFRHTDGLFAIPRRRYVAHDEFL